MPVSRWGTVERATGLPAGSVTTEGGPAGTSVTITGHPPAAEARVPPHRGPHAGVPSAASNDTRESAIGSCLDMLRE